MKTLEEGVGKWFKPDPNARATGYISTINSNDKILGCRGIGGIEVQGSVFAVRIDERVIIFSGWHEQMLDENGNSLKHPKGRQGYYGYRWHSVHFDAKLIDPYQNMVFIADDLTDDVAHKQAVDVAIEFYTIVGLLNLKVPPTREISFNTIGPRPLSDPRNPKEKIYVNQDVD